ncbi:mitochondrion organization and biogenesis protein [Penicillium hetheringtonii]|uniref:Required for respiratory growth protein 9, mitochondrial n=1 Tax=Penicillium hetheringtonii TaxID=911720 RepID=A0AAD6E299_9EURO|nr:mitochondrion organization and biogenesis protein [Penicillium hetheringtonii]
MVFHCASSTKLALSNVLGNVFRSHLAHDLPSSSARRWSSHLLQLQPSQQYRPFVSHSLLLQSQNNIPHSITTESHTTESMTEPKATSDATTPAQQRQTREMKPGSTKPTKKTTSKSETKTAKDNSTSDKDKKKKDNAKKKHWKKKFPDGWNPAKRLSPDALDGIRHLHATAPDRFTTAVLAEEFKVSPEAIRRILKSKWRPSENEMEKRRVRWENRHERIWSQMAELGLRRPSKRAQALSDTRGLFRDKKK